MDESQNLTPKRQKRRPKFSRLKPDTITAMAAVAIASLALELQYWDHYETRAFNRMKVRPYLTAQWDPNSEDGKCGIAIRNDGLGPARIISIQFFDKSGKALGSSSAQDVHALLGRAFNPHGALAVHYNDLTPGSMVRVGEKLYLFYIIPAETNSSAKSDLSAALSQISVTVHYQSLYNETNELPIRLASFLGPH